MFPESYVVRNMSSSNRKLHSKSLVKGKAALAETLQDNASHTPKEISLPSDPTFGTWTAPFDLSGLSTVLQKKLVVMAPCLLGRQKAIYDTDFFHRVYGLCKDGIMPKEVTKAMVPAHTYKHIWMPGEGQNQTRYLLDKCRDTHTQDLYLRLYIRVYGDAPDNKAFSQTFLRACVYFYKDGAKKNMVNWTAAAAQLIEECRAHAGLNPLKLGPPALREQLFSILKEIRAYF